MFVLHLSIAGEWVDVNVHPQKREVRLRQEQVIREMIVKAIREALSHQHKPEVTLSPSMGVSPVFAKAFNMSESYSPREPSSTWEFQPKWQGGRSVPQLQRATQNPAPAAATAICVPETFLQEVKAPVKESSRPLVRAPARASRCP